MKKIYILPLIIAGFIFLGAEIIRTAKVTYYHSKYNGRKTATGDIYNDTNLTCATSDRRYLRKTIKFFNKDTFIVVKCNDMMAPVKELRFDLTKRAFKILHNSSLEKGVSRLNFQVL